MSRPVGVFIVALVSTLCVRAEEPATNALRTWTSRQGMAIEATLEKVSSGFVYLKKPDGKVIAIQQGRLSADDQALLKKLAPPLVTAAAPKAPPKAPQAVYDLFGPTLRDGQKKKVPVDELTGKTIGVYFSAHWCPPCRGFTPKLVDFYNDLQKAKKPFAVVYVSSDRDRDAMYGYMKEMKMPWLALPYGDAHKRSLAAKYSVRGIPKLVILTPEGDLITENGRGDVMGRGPKAFDAWKTPAKRL